MTALRLEKNNPIPPSAPDIDLARNAGQRLARSFKGHTEPKGIKVRLVEDGQPDEVILPAMAVRMLLDILREMAKGNAVNIFPVHAEFTTQQAADFLNVSRPFVVNLLKQGTIPSRKVGTHRRVKFQDLAEYKKRTEQDQDSALAALIAEAQELNLGY